MIEIKVTGENAREALLDLKQLTQGLVGGCSCQDSTGSKEDVKEAKDEQPVKKEKQPKKEVAKHKEEDQQVEDNEDKDDSKQEAQKEAKKDKEEKTYTLVEVRAKAMELQRAGKKDFLKQVIEACGASKLSEIEEEKFAYAMKCFEAGEVLDDEEVPF